MKLFFIYDNHNIIYILRFYDINNHSFTKTLTCIFMTETSWEKMCVINHSITKNQHLSSSSLFK